MHRLVDRVISIVTTPRREFALARLRELLVVYSAGVEFSDEEWREHLAITQQLQTEPATLVLTFSPLCGPTTAQRKEVIQIADGLKTAAVHKQVLITESALARGTLIAMRWFFPTHYAVKAWGTGDIERALSWLLEGSSLSFREIVQLLLDMSNAVGAKQYVDLFEKQLTAAP